MIPYGRQQINDADIESVIEVLRSDFLTTGPAVERFEQGVASYCGVKHAVAVSNATAALHLACLAADLKPGDVSWTSPNTFVASANCALYCGASTDFVDIDPQTFNMSPEALETKLKLAAVSGGTPNMVIPVHFAGMSCDMAAIAKLKKTYGFSIIEDASHAIGGSYCDRKVGACEFSDMAVFSFHPVKIITTGEGGMVLTNRDDLYQRLIRLRTHGITRNSALMTHASDGPWYYQQLELGFNYRLTDLQAALGFSQLQRIDSFVSRRQDLGHRYDEAFAGTGLETQKQSALAQSAHHLYVVQVPEGVSRNRFFEGLVQRGIGANVHYIPVHTQPYYRALGFKVSDFPHAVAYYLRAISLPMYAGLTDAQQAQAIDAVLQTLSSTR